MVHETQGSDSLGDPIAIVSLDELVDREPFGVALFGDVEVGTRTVIGPAATRPLVLERPVFVSDMSFGALSQEAKTALARGAEMAGTGTGGHLPGSKVVGRIAEVRGLPEGTPAVSPARFTDWDSIQDYAGVHP